MGAALLPCSLGCELESDPSYYREYCLQGWTGGWMALPANYSWTNIPSETSGYSGRQPAMYDWERNHPCETSGAGATFTTTFAESWSGNKLRRFWDQRNRKAARRTKLELMPCARHMA